MVSELEGLLRGAAKIAAEESGTGNIHVIVNGDNDKAYLLDTASGTLRKTGVGDDVADELASEVEASRARVHLTYASEDVFLGLAHKRTDPRAAMLTGKISFRGEMALGIKLGYWIRKAAKQEEAAAEVDGGLENVQLEIAETDQWEKDEDTHACAVCEQGFKVYRRRHHCRFCGRVVCQDCSSSKLGGQRACDPCRSRADAALTRHQEVLALEEVASTLQARSGETLLKEQEPVVPREIESRLVQLEEEVDVLDKRSFATRARVLRELVLMVYRLLVLALLALVLLGAHVAASLLARQLGPNLIEVTIGATPAPPVEKPSRSSLSAVVHGACDAAGHLAEVVTTSFDASAGAEEHGKYSGGCFRLRRKTPGTGENMTKWPPRRRRRRRRNNSARPLAASGASAPLGEAEKVHGRPGEEEKEQDKEENKEPEKEQKEDEDEGKDKGRPAASPGKGGLRLSLSLYWTAMVLIGLCLRAYARGRKGLILRRIKTFCLAGTAIFALKMTKKLTQGMSPDEAEDIWADMHKLLAPFMHQCILDVQGMWVKTGQYLSSRADVMPQPYIDELSKLQDAVPASPYDEVDETVKEQLGRPLTDLFATIDREALASASVAQVHRCTLKDGRKAVVKVQHRRVRQLFLEDLRNIDRIVRVVAWADKDYDFRPIINEWASQSFKELDFVSEATNLLRVARAMRQSGLDVIIPELVPEFTRTKVVVMTFCEGFKVTDDEALAAAELDREGVMRKITESFAYQIHIDGLFNGDPHPGNILLQPQPETSSPAASGGTNGEGTKSAMPVLLDWGLAKTLPENLRIAFSRFIYAGCEHDFTSMLVAFEEMGVKLNRFNPAEDMRSIRFLLRDTQSAAESKEDTARFRKRMTKRRGRELKNPIDAYPGDLLFFLRVHALLRGLATRLKVRQKCMDIMAPYAKRALCEVVPLAERATQAVYPSPLLSPLEYKVRKLLEHLVEKEQITGCQVYVIYRGETLVDLCAGTQGPIDPRPVRPSTLFCVFSAGKAVCSTAVHLLADRGLLGYDQRLSELWPEFACNGKEATTVRHVLTHTTGLQHAFPNEATFDRICDWEGMQKVLVEAKPAWSPGSRASYHYFTFGWLVAAIVEKASGVSFEKFVREHIAVPLGLEDSFFLGGLSARGVEPCRIAHVEHTFKGPAGRSENVSGHEEEKESAATGQPTRQATSVGRGRESTSASSAMVGREPSAASKQSVAEEDEVVIGIEDIDKDVGEKGPPRLGLFAAMSSTLKKTDPEEGAAIDDLARKLAGREYFLDPRIFNYPALRDACIPAANGHFNAKALAVLYDNFLGSLGLSGSSSRNTVSGRRAGQHSPLLRRARVNEMRAYQMKETSSLHHLFGLPERGVRWSLGYQMFGFREPVLGSASPNRGRVRLSGFGHVGLGGSMALCDPASGLAFAMVTNKVAGGRESSSAVLSLLCHELGIGDPSHFFED